jgi:probable phosphoglycerate mutase
MVEEIYLVRHGHIDTGGIKRYIGLTDLPLDELGIKQAQQLSEFFKAFPVKHIFTSPLGRCVQTTQIISKNYKCVEGLREINMGKWENVPMIEIRTCYPDAFKERGYDIEHFTPPKGESFKELSKRVMKAFNDIICNYDGKVLIVAHAGVNRVILRELLGVDFQDIFNISQPYGCVNRIWPN